MATQRRFTPASMPLLRCAAPSARRPVCTCRREEQSDAAREEQSDEAREAAREADKRGKQAARAEQSDEARN